jgi:cell division protein FtsQ
MLSFSAWLLFGAALVVLLASATVKKDQQLCAGVIVSINAIQGKVFIDEQEVKQIISRMNGGQINRQALSGFNLRHTEQVLEKEVWIEDAELFFDNNRILQAKIVERYPVARVFNTRGESFYIDSTGRKLPLSVTDRAEVPVFTQFPLHNKHNDSLLNLVVEDVAAIAALIGADEFWNAQAAQIEILPGRRYRMYPTIGFHTVELGDAANMPDKLHRLKAFYSQVYARNDFLSYTKLNVSYRGQVVATYGEDSLRRSIDPVKAVQVFNQMVQRNKKETNANAVESANTTAGRIMPDNGTQVNTLPKKEPVTAAALPAPAALADTIKKPKAVMPQKTSTN